MIENVEVNKGIYISNLSTVNPLYEIVLNCPGSFDSCVIGSGITKEAALKDANETLSFAMKLVAIRLWEIKK